MDVIIIPKVNKFKKFRLNWHIGIDATELEDGTFFISKKVYDFIPDDFEISKDDISVNLKTELGKFSVKKLLPIDFKVSSIEISEIK